MLERFRKKLTKAVTETLKEETIKSVDDILPALVGLTSLVGLCIGVFGKQTPVGSTITINNFYYGRR